MSEKACVVFVDDEVRILKVLKALFRREYNIYTTTDGNEAIEYIKNNHVQAIISDQRMPIMPGVEVLKKVKEVSPDTMRLLLTGYADMQAIISSVNEGEVYRYINKPWSNELLKKTLAEAIEISNEMARESKVSNDDKYDPIRGSKETHTPINAKTKQRGSETAQAENILVIDDDKKLAKAIALIVKDKFGVLYASSVESAFSILAEKKVGVLVSDVRVGGEDMTYALKQLKQQYPKIIGLLISETKDSHMLATMINQAQIFRFLPKKPLSQALLKSSIIAALKRHKTLSKMPLKLKQHTVEKTTEPPPIGLSSRILDYLRNIRKK